MWFASSAEPPGNFHYDDVIMGAIASQITSHTIVYSTVYSDADQRKHQSSASRAFVWGIHRNSLHKWPVTRKMFPFDDVIMFPKCNSLSAALLQRHPLMSHSKPNLSTLNTPFDCRFGTYCYSHLFGYGDKPRT